MGKFTKSISFVFTVFSLGMLLFGCSEASEDTDISSVCLNFELAETSDVMLDHGVQYNVSEPERERLLGREETLIRQEKETLSLKKQMEFVIDSVDLTYAEGKRVSAIYEGADSLGTDGDFSPVFNAEVMCEKNIGEENEDKILSYLHEEYGYAYSGVIAQSESAFLPVDGAGYQAVLFYPRVYTISGLIKDESTAYSIEICFPCVNTLGCVDGLYSVYTASSPDEIPDLE